LTLYSISSVKSLQGIPVNHTTKNDIVLSVTQITSFVVFSVLVMGYVKKIKLYSLQESVFNYVLFPQKLCNSKFQSVSQPFDEFILIELAWAQGLESALTCLIIRTIYGETTAAPQFTVISPVGNSPYKAAGEKTSSDTVSHRNPDRPSKKLWW